jgi:polyisoprenoid-binding protein YceI
VKKIPLGAAALCAMAWLTASASNTSYTTATSASKLEFTGTQAGAEFTGMFYEYTVSVARRESLSSGERDVQK